MKLQLLITGSKPTKTKEWMLRSYDDEGRSMEFNYVNRSERSRYYSLLQILYHARDKGVVPSFTWLSNVNPLFLKNC